MNAENRQFVAKMLAALPRPSRVIEIGSRNVNGAVRDLFDGAEYTGVDLLPGTGVDVVVDATAWRSEKPADIVVCCNVLEHSERAADIVASAYAMLGQRGCLILTTVTDPWPGHSALDGGALRDGEHYHNPTMEELCEWLTCFDNVELWPQQNGQVFALATKGELMVSKYPPHPVFTERGRDYTTCSRCNRLLYAEHGPTCPGCVAAIEAEEKAAEASE